MSAIDAGGLFVAGLFLIVCLIAWWAYLSGRL